VIPLSRRRFIAGAAGLLVPAGAMGAALVATPRQAEGPFYPDPLPSERDHDLVQVGAAAARALGEVTHLTGRVLDLNGRPLAQAVVEIWQVDANGIYLHPAEGARAARRDRGFQGYGHTRTDARGEYAFRTLRPVAYPGRAPHIHCRVWHRRQPLLTTQLYVAGEALNARDWLLNHIADEAQRRAVIVPFIAAGDTAPGEWQARFDIVLGLTPRDPA